MPRRRARLGGVGGSGAKSGEGTKAGARAPRAESIRPAAQTERKRERENEREGEGDRGIVRRPPGPVSLPALFLAAAGPTATLLEWDDRIPPFDEVHREALKARRYLDAVVAASAAGANVAEVMA